MIAEAEKQDTKSVPLGSDMPYPSGPTHRTRGVRLRKWKKYVLKNTFLLGKYIRKDSRRKSDEELLGKLPDDDAGGGTDIERMLGAELRYFDAAVGCVNDFLMHSLHFIAEHDGIA